MPQFSSLFGAKFYLDKELDALLWLAVNKPHVFLFENEQKDFRQMRLRKLMAVVSALEGKHIEVELTKPIDKDADRRCRKCGKMPSYGLNKNSLCWRCSQREFFESIKKVKLPEVVIPKTCSQCGKTFEPSRQKIGMFRVYGVLYCSEYCRERAHYVKAGKKAKTK